MQLLVLSLLLAQTPWPVAARLTPPLAGESRVRGEGAPSNLVVFGNRRVLTLHATGPGLARLHLYGLVPRRGRRPASAGKLEVRLDQGDAKLVELSNAVVPGFTISTRPLLAVTEEHELAVDLAAGPHVITVRSTGDTPAGWAMWVEVPASSTTGAEEPELLGLEPQAAVPADSTSQAPESADTTEAPDLAAPPTAPSAAARPAGPDEPDILAGVQARELGAREPGYSVLAPEPPVARVEGPSGVEPFRLLTIEHGLALEVVGPGFLGLELHAHRSAKRPETLEPLVLGILLNDVLMQTVSVAEPADPRYKEPGSAYELSRRVLVSVAVPAGAHQLSVALSDNAALGASARVRFDTLPTVSEVLAERDPIPGSSSVPSSPHVSRTSPDSAQPSPAPLLGGQVHAGVLGGAFAPLGLRTLGIAALGELELEAPALASDLAIGLMAGYATAEDEQLVTDPRAAGGLTATTVRLSSVPVLADLRMRVGARGPLRLTVGAGGGVAFNYGQTRAGGGRYVDELRARAAVHALASLRLALGPGDLVARVQLVAAPALSNRRIVDPSSALVLVGYSLAIGDF